MRHLNHDVTETRLALAGQLEDQEPNHFAYGLNDHSKFGEGFEAVAAHIQSQKRGVLIKNQDPNSKKKYSYQFANDGELITQSERQLFEDCPIHGNHILRPELNRPKKADWQRIEFVANIVGCSMRHADIIIESLKALDLPSRIAMQCIERIAKTSKLYGIDRIVDKWADLADSVLAEEAGESRELEFNSAPAQEYKYSRFADEGDFRPFIPAKKYQDLVELTETTDDPNRLKGVAVWIVEEKALLWEDGQNYWPIYHENRIRLLPDEARKEVALMRATKTKGRLFGLAKLLKAKFNGQIVNGSYSKELHHLSYSDKKLMWKEFRKNLERVFPSFR